MYVNKFSWSHAYCLLVFYLLKQNTKIWNEIWNRYNMEYVRIPHCHGNKLIIGNRGHYLLYTM